MTGPAARSGIVSDSVWIVIGTAVAQVVLVVTSVTIKRLLGPEDVAAWALASSVLGYLALTQFGVLESLLLRGPLLLTRRGGGLRGLAVPAYGWMLIVAVPGVLAVGLFALSSRAHASASSLLAVGLVLPMIAPYQLATLGVTVARVRGDFKRVAVATVVNGLVSGVAGVGLVYTFGLRGQAAAFALGLLAQLAIYAPYRHTAVAWGARLTRRQWRTAVAMIRYGFVFQSGSAVFVVRQAVDTVLAVMVLSPVPAGVYALAASFRSYLVMLPQAFGTVLYRALRTHHGAARVADGRPPWEWWVAAMGVNFLLLVLPGAILMSFAGPIVVRWFLPRFVGAPMLVAVVPLAAATMMMEPVPLQRLLAGGATGAFQATSLIALGGAVIGITPGLAMRSPVIAFLGVAAANLGTFGFAMWRAMRLSALTAHRRAVVAGWCLAGLAAVGSVAGVGCLLEAGLRARIGGAVLAVGALLALASLGVGAFLARNIRATGAV